MLLTALSRTLLWFELQGLCHSPLKGHELSFEGGKQSMQTQPPMPCLPLVPLGGVSGGNNPHVLDSHGLCLFSILWWIKSHQNSCISMQKQMHWYIRAWCKWLQIHCRWYFHVCLLEKVTRWKCVLVTFKNESVYLSFSAKTKMPGMFLLL